MSNESNLLRLRAREAKGKSDFFDGKTDRHPHGQSGLRFILPYENDRRMKNYALEWAFAAGFDMKGLR